MIAKEMGYMFNLEEEVRIPVPGWDLTLTLTLTLPVPGWDLCNHYASLCVRIPVSGWDLCVMPASAKSAFELTIRTLFIVTSEAANLVRSNVHIYSYCGLQIPYSLKIQSKAKSQVTDAFMYSNKQSFRLRNHNATHNKNTTKNKTNNTTSRAK